MHRFARRTALAVAAVAVAAPVGSAAAAEIPGGLQPLSTPETTFECTAPTLSTPFASFGDRRSYVLAPGGDFGADRGWQLRGGAALVNGQLALPPGAQALSPAMCVDLNYPTARTFVRQFPGDTRTKLSVIYDTGKVAFAAQDVGEVKGPGMEQHLVPSDDLQIRPDLAGTAPGWRKVAFLLTATGRTGSDRLDNFFVDPRMLG